MSLRLKSPSPTRKFIDPAENQRKEEARLKALEG